MKRRNVNNPLLKILLAYYQLRLNIVQGIVVVVNPYRREICSDPRRFYRSAINYWAFQRKALNCWKFCGPSSVGVYLFVFAFVGKMHWLPVFWGVPGLAFLLFSLSRQRRADRELIEHAFKTKS